MTNTYKAITLTWKCIRTKPLHWRENEYVQSHYLDVEKQTKTPPKCRTATASIRGPCNQSVVHLTVSLSQMPVNLKALTAQACSARHRLLSWGQFQELSRRALSDTLRRTVPPPREPEFRFGWRTRLRTSEACSETSSPVTYSGCRALHVLHRDVQRV